MKIPSSFKLGAHTWKVKVVKSLGELEGAFYGQCDYDNHVIHIAKLVRGKRQSDSAMYQTFLHEFVHAALHILGRNDDEELAAGLEQMYFQLAKTAKYPKVTSPDRDKP